MKKKIIIACVLILLVIIGIIPILKNNDKEEGKDSKSDELTIYLIDDDTVQRTLLEKYKLQYLDVKVNEVVFDDYDSYYEQLNKDLLAGKGPDLIFGTVYGIERLNKLIDSGVFMDLNELIEKDEKFNIDDYNKVVMDSGIYDGKRYFMPFDYICSSYLTTKSALEENNIKYTENQSYSQFIDSLSECLESKKDIALFDNGFSFSKFAFNMGCEFIDYEKKKVNCDTDEFKKLVELYKKIKEEDNSEELLEQYKYDRLKMIEDKKLLFMDTYSILYNLYYFYGQLKEVNEEGIYLGDQANVAYPYNIMAINSKSKHKEEAFNYIKMGLSKSFQGGDALAIYTALPVNTVANEYLNNRAINSNAYLKSEETDLMVEKLKKEMNEIEKSYVVDITVEQLVEKELESYIDDKSSLKECIKSIEEKLNLYFKE